MDIREFMAQTEHAVKQLFDSIKYYQELLLKSVGPIFVTSYSNEEDLALQRQQWFKEHEDEWETSLHFQKEFFAQYFSYAVICGSVLQIAHTGINAFSDNESVAKQYEHLVLGDKGKKYCIGREVRKIPIGLIIYAGRIQHIHVEDGEYGGQTNIIFKALADYYIERIGEQDPGFLLSEMKFESKAPSIFSLLKWDDYNTYKKDMMDMLGPE